MKKLLSILFLLSFIIGASAQSGWEIRLLPQIAFGTKNTVQRPNDNSSTRFSLSKDLKRKNSAAFSPRIEVEYYIKKHHIIATAMWLQNKFEGKAPFDILYDGGLFRSDTPVEALYRFDTYRLGYRFRLVETPQLILDLGATLLLRDAVIWLEDSEKKSSFYNVGVAPLLSYNLEWLATDKLSIWSYGDAFAIKAGRAEDIFAGFKYRFTPLMSANLGYRFLEGGSDGDRVYTMSAFHFISMGLTLSF